VIQSFRNIMYYDALFLYIFNIFKPIMYIMYIAADVYEAD